MAEKAVVDFDEIPTSQLLLPPEPGQVPGAIIEMRLNLRDIGRQVKSWRTTGNRIVMAVLAASFTVTSTVIGSAIYLGARMQSVEDMNREIERHDGRITHVEQKLMEGRGRD